MKTNNINTTAAINAVMATLEDKLEHCRRTYRPGDNEIFRVLDALQVLRELEGDLEEAELEHGLARDDD